ALPVLGLPVKSSTLNGQDSLLSIVQMPAGIPVATFAIGMAGSKNAALFAASILQHTDINISKAIAEFRDEQKRFLL
ncbi:AIR carboxylase family protein, partial [Francisella tularensis subsp. holarctica]|uniref:AIR carboxylase family protein n=1 Tax=Francisella tularensis TaxID=263 RepID=UPI002381C850